MWKFCLALAATIAAPLVRGENDASEIARLKEKLTSTDQAKEVAQVFAKSAQNKATAEASLLAQTEEQLKSSEGNLRAAQKSAAGASERASSLEEPVRDAQRRVQFAEESRSKAEAQRIEQEKRLKVLQDRSSTATFSSNLATTGQGVDKGVGDFAKYLRDLPYQPILAGAAGVFGILCWGDAHQYARGLIILSVAISAGTIGGAQALNCWGDALGAWGPGYIGIEIAAITAVAAYLGFEGFRLLAGCLLGMFVARFIKNISRDVQGAAVAAKVAQVAKAAKPEEIVVWYSCFALAGGFLMFIGRENALAIMGPLVGGLFVSSGVGYFVEEMTGNTTSTVAWIDILQGVVEEKNSAQLFQSDYTRPVCLAVWFTVAAYGCARWFFGWGGSSYEDDEIEFAGRPNVLNKPLLANGRGNGMVNAPPPAMPRSNVSGRAPPQVPPRRGGRQAMY